MNNLDKAIDAAERRIICDTVRALGVLMRPDQAKMTKQEKIAFADADTRVVEVPESVIRSGRK